MRKTIKKLKRVNKIAKFFLLVFTITYVISLAFFSKNVLDLEGIETFLRYALIVFFILYLLFYFFASLKKMMNKKYAFFFLSSIITSIFISVFIFGSFAIDTLVGKISSINEKDKIEYTSYLITLTDTKIDSDSIWGMIDDEVNIEGNILAKQIISDHKLTQKIKKYDSQENDAFLEMLYDLYDGKIDGLFISNNYVTLYSSEEDFGNIANETKVVYKKSGLFDNKDLFKTNNKSLKEPFTVLLMGVDSEYDGLNANAAFNGDTLILATFNPKTLTATLLSLPRDIYVPIACRNNNYAKINSSAAYGTSCVIKTIENLTDISIDYYLKINFKGVVDLVEAVGGVTVDVEEPDYEYNHGHYCGGKVCEQDSNRIWGDHTIYIKPGMQTLNGEEALAYARCRGVYLESDIARNRHQQDIIMALAKKALHIKNYNSFKKILDAISSNIATNMSTNQILSSYNILKDMVGKVIKDEDIINIQKTKLEVYSLPVYLPSGNTTSALGYYESSLRAIIESMKINLELEEPEIIKTFTYSLNENYESKAVGEGLRSGSSNSVLANFVGKTKEAAEKYCEENDLDCSFKYVDENSTYFDEDIGEDLIATQLPHANTLMKNVSSITFYINGKSIKRVDEKKNEKPSEKDKEVEEETDTDSEET